jgi:hypothetical protein
MGIKKTKPKSQDPIVKTDVRDRALRFSFSLFHRDDEEVCPRLFSEGYVRTLMERLRDLSTWKVGRFTGQYDKAVQTILSNGRAHRDLTGSLTSMNNTVRIRLGSFRSPRMSTAESTASSLMIRSTSCGSTQSTGCTHKRCTERRDERSQASCPPPFLSVGSSGAVGEAGTPACCLSIR